MYDGSKGSVGGRGKFMVLYAIHGGVEYMRLDYDGDLSDLGHGVLLRVIWFLLDHALPLCWFGPVLLEYAIGNPSLTRPRQRLSQDAAIPTKRMTLVSVTRLDISSEPAGGLGCMSVPFLNGLVVLGGEIIRLCIFHGGKRIARLD